MPLGTRDGTENRARTCRLAPDLLLERFKGQALVLLANDDRFLTVDHAAADLMALIRVGLEATGFDCASLAALLARHYALAPGAAQSEASLLIEEWLEQGILVPGIADRSTKG
jgi:hypothetical protein